MWWWSSLDWNGQTNVVFVCVYIPNPILSQILSCQHTDTAILISSSVAVCVYLVSRISAPHARIEIVQNTACEYMVAALTSSISHHILLSSSFCFAIVSHLLYLFRASACISIVLYTFTHNKNEQEFYLNVLSKLLFCASLGSDHREFKDFGAHWAWTNKSCAHRNKKIWIILGTLCYVCWTRTHSHEFIVLFYYFNVLNMCWAHGAAEHIYSL